MSRPGNPPHPEEAARAAVSKGGNSPPAAFGGFWTLAPVAALRAAGALALLALGAPVLAQTAPAPAPTSADGVWVGRADGGGAACGPLEVRITIEGGLLDGTATEPDSGPSALRGKRGEQLPVPPALWQLNGRARGDGAVDIIGLRSMKDRDRQRSRWSGRAAAGSVSIAETDGPCRRSATLARGR